MPTLGLDYLGLGSSHWNLKQSIASFPQGWALGCFDTIFGDVIPNLRKFLDTGKVSIVRTHIYFDSLHRIVPTDILKTRCPIYEQLAKDYPSVKFIISHTCEYNENNLDVLMQRINIIQNKAPSCEIVQSKMIGAILPGFPKEEHGDTAQVKNGGIISPDGENIYDFDATKYVRSSPDARIIFGWGTRFNLRTSADVQPPPKERTITPPPRYIASIVRLLQPKALAPIKPGAIKLKAPSLWKTHSEDYGGGPNSRDNKPVLIIPNKHPTVKIITKDSQLIDKIFYYGPFGSNLHRYYVGGPDTINLYGYELAVKALELSGSEYIYIEAGKQVYGPIHPAFRTPYFHS